MMRKFVGVRACSMQTRSLEGRRRVFRRETIPSSWGASLGVVEGVRPVAGGGL